MNQGIVKEDRNTDLYCDGKPVIVVLSKSDPVTIENHFPRGYYEIDGTSELSEKPTRDEIESFVKRHLQARSEKRVVFNVAQATITAAIEQLIEVIDSKVLSTTKDQKDLQEFLVDASQRFVDLRKEYEKRLSDSKTSARISMRMVKQ